MWRFDHLSVCQPPLSPGPYAGRVEVSTGGAQIRVYSPNRKSATDAVVPLLTNSPASSSRRSFRLDDSHSSMAKPVADRMEGFRAKGDLVGNINLKVLSGRRWNVRRKGANVDVR